jgi:hypothetical protein
MSLPTPSGTDPFDDTLAARAAARDILIAMAAREPAAATASVTRAELWAFANRAPQEPTPFTVARALKTDATAQDLYRRMLALRATAASERAAAAHAGGPFERKLPGALLRIVEEDGAPPALLISLDPGAAAPRLIEVVALEGMVRRALPEAIDGHIVLELPRQDAELDLLRILLANPQAGVYLLA